MTKGEKQLSTQDANRSGLVTKFNRYMYTICPNLKLTFLGGGGE